MLLPAEWQRLSEYGFECMGLEKICLSENVRLEKKDDGKLPVSFNTLTRIKNV